MKFRPIPFFIFAIGVEHFGIRLLEILIEIFCTKNVVTYLVNKMPKKWVKKLPIALLDKKQVNVQQINFIDQIIFYAKLNSSWQFH